MSRRLTMSRFAEPDDEKPERWINDEPRRCHCERLLITSQELGNNQCNECREETNENKTQQTA